MVQTIALYCAFAFTPISTLSLNPESRGRHVTYVDTITGWEYTPGVGKQQLFADPSMPSVESGWFPEGGTTDYRRLRSIVGHRKIEGTITLGSVTGVNVYPGEAAYNYFGVSTESLDFEFGLTYWADQPNVWRFYYNRNGAGTVRETWPPGGIPIGTAAFIRLYVSDDGEVTVEVICNAPEAFGPPVPIGHTFVYTGLKGLVENGVGQRVRRVTSLMLQDGGGSTLSNVWSGVSIATATHSYLWTPAYTQDITSTSNVTPTTYNADYHEQVNITVL